MKLHFKVGHNMMANMKKSDRKIYFAGLRAFLKDMHLTQGILATAINKDQTTISNYMNCKTRPLDEYYEAFESVIGKTRKEIFDYGHEVLSETLLPRQRTRIATNDNPVLSIHHQIIEQFQQKELALEINHAMLELERMNPDELKEIAKYVHFRKSEAKKIQPPAPQKKRG
jgi:hypothetical protein